VDFHWCNCSADLRERRSQQQPQLPDDRRRGDRHQRRGSYGLAEALHKEIKEVTDQPVKLVVNENGQGHAALGNCYWAKQGVKIIAHEDAAHEFEQRSHQIMQAAEARLKDRAANNCVKVPDETFSDKKDVSMGNMKVELLHLGPAHSPGDMQVWLPEEKLVIAGDMAFHERLLPIFDDTDTASWVETWENEFEKLGAFTSFRATAIRPTWPRCGATRTITWCICAARSASTLMAAAGSTKRST
jgi:glyoxylase-like metal-dependent hydrolase (beta-lactamase superfamily II)